MEPTPTIDRIRDQRLWGVVPHPAPGEPGRQGLVAGLLGEVLGR